MVGLAEREERMEKDQKTWDSVNLSLFATLLLCGKANVLEVRFSRRGAERRRSRVFRDMFF
ncbi:MAG TPA: hypothetical protein DDZ88_17790 [Verrucomicrobiales bacterium]|nr:hypothetical protein [Verrucomicrobiales bacterium]